MSTPHRKKKTRSFTSTMVLDDTTIDYAETEFLLRSNLIWKHFWVKKGGLQCVCRRCHTHFNAVFRPGSYRATFNTTRHMRAKHPDLYQEYLTDKATCVTDKPYIPVPEEVGHHAVSNLMFTDRNT